MTHGRPFAVLLLLFAAGPAHADNGSLAEALFRDARQAMRDGNYDVACPKLAESQRLDPSVGTRLNLAMCEERRGHVATAWGHYRALADELPRNDERVPVAIQQAKALEPRLPWLRIVLPANAGDASVDVDGTALRDASIGTALPVDPGAHVITVRRGDGARTTNVTVAEGEHSQVVFDLALARHDVELAQSPPPRPHPSARATGGWATVAAGVAGVAASLVLGALVLEKKAVVAGHCPNKQCDSTGLAAGRAGTTLEEAATVSFAAGWFAVGAGALLVATAPSAAPRAKGSFLTLQGTF